jgi:transcriptional regulator with XRE-family HTH domain
MSHPIDVHVGQRIRQRRLELAMSQSQLAECSGVTCQQIQKYEQATNRISASRLWQIAEALDVSISHFFDDFDTDGCP